MAKVLLCNAEEGAQKVGTILQLSYQALYFHGGYMQEISRFEKTPCPIKHCLVEKNPQKVRCYDCRGIGGGGGFSFLTVQNPHQKVLASHIQKEQTKYNKIQ